MEEKMNFNSIKVDSRGTFLDFLRLFQENLEVNEEEWENKTLKDFLEALERYTKDVDGYYINTGQLEENADVASWKRFADILRGARVYE